MEKKEVVKVKELLGNNGERGTPFLLGFLEKIEVPPTGSANCATYVGATPTPSGDAYDYDQD
ncbi:hypothetical protein A2442_01470 [Candidatus Campbellbacteria bacterium RIFOXYC2_FULL_35_25]|uniref:Uncharacterized protein n=1 Tax=Candidatus Campbellbacteria bacterium RIFOXYC2_FULL_35_25 TaxID=1797582 RepID=A0A1F5EHD2_9BACT|nr:MAG: hypothetical protein A2442_01470 [Candidatus Campbellbacteria bacterium RIFOXYC2_FULL_35_25]